MSIKDFSLNHPTYYGIAVGLLVGITFALGGFGLYVHGGQNMGVVLFIAVPFVTGFAVV
jgi:hypothetical protein